MRGTYHGDFIVLGVYIGPHFMETTKCPLGVKHSWLGDAQKFFKLGLGFGSFSLNSLDSKP